MTGGPATELAPLRAADWRFLLPQPPGNQFVHLVLAGGTSALVGRVLDLGLARRVSDLLPGDRSADAVVALRRSPAKPADLAASLAPGGTLYWEIERRTLRHFGSTPARLRRALEAEGLAVTGVFAVGPGVSRPRVYLPLDAAGALRWYVDTLYNPWTRSLALAEAALRFVTGLEPNRLSWLATDLAVTARAGTAPHPPSLLETAIREVGFDGEPLRPLMLTSTHQETLSQRVVALPFPARGSQPVVVVKVSKSAGLNATIESERRTLAGIRGLLDPEFRRTIPAPLNLVRVGDLAVASETYLPGESLQRATCRWDRSTSAKLDDLRLAATWLAEFHRQTMSERPLWSPAESGRWVMEPVDRYRATFAETEAERQLFLAAERYAARLDGLPLPIVIRKPDFFGSNVVRAGHALSVLDWESSYPGPALCDLLRFVVPWSDVVSGRRGRRSYENFRRLFFGPVDADPVVRGVHRVIDEYLERLDLDRRLVPILLLHTWLERALHHADKQRAQADPVADARRGNRHVARIGVMADEVDRLFGVESHWWSTPGNSTAATGPS